MPNWETVTQHPFWLWLQQNQEWLAGIIIVTAFIESFAILGIIVPGVILLAMAAFLAGSGVLDLSTTLICAGLGAVAGDGSSYLIGRYFHRHITHWWPFYQHQNWVDKGERFFLRYGAISVFLGRFIGPIRPVMPLVAGSLFMPKRQFFAINIVSACLWAPFYILPGYMAGKAIEWDPQWQRWGFIVMIGFGLVVALLLWARNRYKLEHEE
ncbi:MAG: DedA family protein [Pseudomonadales bacterium]